MDGLRRLTAEDAHQVGDLVAQCSVQTLRDRFFGCPARPAELLAGQIVEGATNGSAMGWFAVDGLVAVAVSLPIGVSWEIGLLVADAWQARRVGTSLAGMLVADAVTNGRPVVAYVEVANVRAVRLVRGLRREYGDVMRIDVA